MRIRSQEQVPNFMGHHVGQERMPKLLSFGKFLNTVIENICEVADSLVIRISGTQHIAAITNLDIDGMRDDLERQVGSIRVITAFRFDF